VFFGGPALRRFANRAIDAAGRVEMAGCSLPVLERELKLALVM